VRSRFQAARTKTWRDEMRQAAHLPYAFQGMGDGEKGLKLMREADADQICPLFGRTSEVMALLAPFLDGTARYLRDIVKGGRAKHAEIFYHARARRSAKPVL